MLCTVKKGEAWPLGHVFQQSWQKQVQALAVPKLEVKSILGRYVYVPARVPNPYWESVLGHQVGHWIRGL